MAKSVRRYELNAAVDPPAIGRVVGREGLVLAVSGDFMVRLMRIFNRMILAHGFFHADPHPGNIFVNPNERGKPVFTLLDFGLSKQLPDGFGMGLFELMFSMMTFNESAMLRAFRELGFDTKTGDDASLLLIARRMISRSDTGTFQGEFTEDMTNEMFDAIRENPVCCMIGNA